MAKFTVTITTATIRDVDGCDSDNAIDSILASVDEYAQKWAEKHEAMAVVLERTPRQDRGPTVTVNHDQWGANAEEDTYETEQLAAELEEEIDRVIDMAIEAGNWEE